MIERKNINGIRHTAEAKVNHDSTVSVTIKKADKAVFNQRYMCSVEAAITLAYHQYQQVCLK